jgi:hypothetical protein
MPTELLDLRLAFRALSDEDSDEGADETVKGDDITDDEVEDTDVDGNGDDDDENEERIEE